MRSELQSGSSNIIAKRIAEKEAQREILFGKENRDLPQAKAYFKQQAFDLPKNAVIGRPRFSRFV